mmetsp:Transcript_26557/g.47703  ORF Transcript_26557/g.47703 Transcript_26557/m.47703 type:complete len:231 (+) Transcript_26557:2686-3378(+)
MLRDLVVAFADASEEVVVVNTSEWKTPTQHGEEKDSQSPNIHWLGLVVPPHDDLRCHVIRSAAESPRLALSRQDCREAEVNNFHVFLIIEQDILELDVSVRHVQSVAVVDCLYNLSEESLDALFRQSFHSLLPEVAVKRQAPAVLHHDVDLTRAFQGFMQANYVRMFKFLQNLHLAFNTLFALWVLQVRLFVGFDRYFLLSSLVRPHLDCGVRALAEYFPYCVIFNPARE